MRIRSMARRACEVALFLALSDLHFLDLTGKHSQIVESNFRFELKCFNAVAQNLQRIDFSFGSYRGDHLIIAPMLSTLHT